MKLTLFALLLTAHAAVSQGVTAFTLADSTLAPEGIAYSTRHQTFYLSSILQDKIVSVKRGVATDFIPTGYQGFTGGIGLHVDEKRQVLWANFGRQIGGYYHTGVMAFQLPGGELLRQFTLPRGGRHLLNDLVIAPDQAVYITDTFDQAVYHYDPRLNTLTRWLQDARLAFPNGITISPDGQTLYVASDRNGLCAIDLKTKHIRVLETPRLPISTRGIDGLMWYKNSLIGIQNGPDAPQEHQIVQYKIRPSGQLAYARRIDRNHSAFRIPTTGVIVGDSLFCIANSHIDAIDQADNTIRPGSRLTKPIVLRYRLKR